MAHTSPPVTGFPVTDVRKMLVRVFVVAFVSTAWLGVCATTSAETDSERIEALEQKLQRTLELVESLQHEINNMKEELANETEESAALSKEVDERLEDNGGARLRCGSAHRQPRGGQCI